MVTLNPPEDNDDDRKVSDLSISSSFLQDLLKQKNIEKQEELKQQINSSSDGIPKNLEEALVLMERMSVPQLKEFCRYLMNRVETLNEIIEKGFKRDKGIE